MPASCQDIDGREIRVKVSQGSQNTPSILSSYQDITFESSYKAFIGNLAWSMTVDKLREHFTQFGSVLSARLLRDRRYAQKRVYGFVSFESEDQLKTAIAASGMVCSLLYPCTLLLLIFCQVI